jgi:UrcA family protein
MTTLAGWQDRRLPRPRAGRQIRASPKREESTMKNQSIGPRTAWTQAPALAAVMFSLAGTAVAAPAAGADSDQRSMTVHLADLRLDREAGAAVALRRIHSAASAVCSRDSDRHALAPYAQYQPCVIDTVERAVAALDLPVVTDLELRGQRASSTLLARR